MATNNLGTLETLLAASTRLVRISAQRTGSPVTSSTWTVLSVLAADGPHRAGDLARITRISHPGMTRIVQQLVQDEWVMRVADVDDSRAWLLVITERGRHALVAWRRELAEAMADVFTGLTAHEWGTLDHAAEILASRVARVEAGASAAEAAA